MHLIKMNEFHKLENLYHAEEKKYKDNETTKIKLFKPYQQHNANIDVSTQSEVLTADALSFSSIENTLTYDIFKTFQTKLKKEEMVSFVHARSKSVIRAGRTSYQDVPTKKCDVFERMWALHNAPLQPRRYPTQPAAPVMP